MKKLIVAKTFFTEFAPTVKNWRNKMAGHNGYGKKTCFTEADKKEIKAAKKEFISRLSKIDFVE